MCERDGDAHPMPGVFLVVGCFVPVGHEEEGLDEGYAVDFVIKVVEHLGTQISKIPQ
jgi:hypothetical protein